MSRAIFLVVAILSAGDAAGAGDLTAFQQGDKWGFKDAAGKVVVAPKYEKVGNFYCGLAPVNVDATRQFRSNTKTGGKWGYIDTKGTVIVPITLHFACEFSDGLGRVLDDRGTRYLDARGDVVIDLGQVNAGDFREGLAPVYEDRSLNGMDWQTRFIDKSGQTVFTVDGYAEEFYEEMAVLSVRQDADGERKLYGYIDRSGKIVVPPRFGEAMEFHEGLAAVRTKKTTGYYGKGDSWGYIEKSGRYVIEPQFNEAHQFRNGIARVHDGGTLQPVSHFPPYWEGGEWLLIDRTGKVVKRSKKWLEYEEATAGSKP